ncbi:GNAT family N-acetyltransferase [Mesorhizobium sp. M0051]|uniref:GNAT family N-acetyltransferase n=1 Tax=Mesorhizobium sp. M0051 TaxID=2956862 RepID=UPI00333C98BE
MLQTRRLLLREWKDEDVDTFARINDDPRVVRYLEGNFPDRAAIEAWRNFQCDHFRTYGYGIWALEALGAGGCIGFCGLMNVPIRPPSRQRLKSPGGWIQSTGGEGMQRRRRPLHFRLVSSEVD